MRPRAVANRPRLPAAANAAADITAMQHAAAGAAAVGLAAALYALWRPKSRDRRLPTRRC